MSILTEKMKILKNILQSLQPGVLALSGGIDSTVLANFIKKWNLDFLCVFFSGPHITDFEKRWVKEIVKKTKIKYSEVEIELLDLEPIKKNQRDRCYFCKKRMFTNLQKLYPERKIIEGSHLDDEKEYRPGSQALNELNGTSPFKLAKITKKDIREIALYENLNPSQFPSRPCLLTRFPYDYEITKEELNKINQMETYLLIMGLRQFRIRKESEGYFLHIEESENKILTKNYPHILEKATKLCIKPFKIELVKNVSGYFDKKQKGGYYGK